MMYQLFWLFFIYAFLGWCMEVCYVALLKGRFVNRGFLNGPFCPIYGFGALFVLELLTPLQGSKPLLFLGGMALTSLLELTTGFVLEKLFHQRWWDYSDQPFNLGGYICLRFSVGWGLACLFVVYLLHPTVLLLVRLLPHTLGLVLLAVLCCGLLIDLTATVGTVTKLNRRLSQIDELAEAMRTLSEELGENLADTVLDAAERHADRLERLEDRADDLREDVREELSELKDLVELRRMDARREWEQLRQRLEDVLDDIPAQSRLLRAFPKLRSLDHKNALERLRQRKKES